MTRYAAKSRSFNVPDPVRGLEVPVWMTYPVPPPAQRTAGADAAEADDSAPAPGRHPVVIVSHGGGGSNLIYRALCIHLSRCGYVVAAPEHPGNNRRDNSLGSSMQVLEDRPRHVSLVIDALAAHPLVGSVVQTDRVAVAGHSFGGYTALALAGGRPYSREREPVRVQRDDRVCALVLMAPATAWYLAPESLRAVGLPILLLRAEHDEITPRWHGDLVVNGVADPALVTDVTVANAGHYSFLTPFPQARTGPDLPPSMDPPGFDRVAFHAAYPQQVAQFLAAHLPVQAPAHPHGGPPPVPGAAG